MSDATRLDANVRQPVIMAIDDEPAILASLTEVFDAAGYRCHTVSDASAAVAIATSLVPELIVCDINLAGESGLELCQQIKAKPELADVPVMFLSGAPIPDVIQRAHAAGGTYYLRKPFDPQVLIELVEKALWMPHLVRHRLNRPATASS